MANKQMQKELSLITRWLMRLAIIICIIPNAVNATENVNTKLIRQTFIEAEKLTYNNKSTKYTELYNQLYFYPLRPYLDLATLQNNLSLNKIAEIDRFLENYEKSPLDWPLRKKWLYYLAKKQRPALFLKYYKSTSDAKLQCYHKRFQLAAGIPKSVVLPKVTSIWQVGKSQPKVCDPLFKIWQKAGYRTTNVVWQRLKNAADGGKHTLIPYLTKLLPTKQQYLGVLWHKVRRNPTRESEILVYGLKRLIWRQPDRAISLFKKIEKKYPLNSTQRHFINRKFALALASKNHQQAEIWLNKLDANEISPDLLQWKLVIVLKNQNWTKINAEMQQFPASFKKTLKWRYWYARSLIETNNQALGKAMLKSLADKRHYYGFLAAKYLQLPININDQPLIITEKEKKLVMQYGAAKRAFEFYYLARYHDARKEWNYWLSQLNDRQKLVAAKIANELGWLDRGIFTLAEVGYLNDIDLRFPLAYNKEINYFAKLNKINPTWAFAITRRESSFMPDAHSSAGAKGLMQVIPSTARHVLGKKINSRYLLDANNNINIGTKYLQKLLDKNNGNQVLATASYNAGPNRIKDWLAKGTQLAADVWIETIPYKETREYVKSVLAYQQIYQIKTGENNSIFDEVGKMTIGQ